MANYYNNNRYSPAMLICFVVLLPAVFLTSRGVGAIQNYCSMNNYPTNGTTYMQFTKETSVDEFAIVGMFKALHCCAKGYRSIEWYKDNNPYPWGGNLILYPEDANQTVWTKSVTIGDTGNYTCLLRNDSVVHARTIQLTVFEHTPDDPKITYVSPSTEVAVGHSLRLFCEAFAGPVDLPDAYSEVVWRKEDHHHHKGNSTLDNDQPRVRQERVLREANQTFGTYLIINDVKKSDFGEYVCRISKPGKTIERRMFVRERVEVTYLVRDPFPIMRLMVMLFIMTVCVIVLIGMALSFGLRFSVKLKDYFGALERNDGKTSDILVLHSPKDAQMCREVFIRKLEKKYGYTCTAMELPFEFSSWYTVLKQECMKSRRVIAVLSPDCFAGEKWTQGTICKAVKILQDIHRKIIVVSLRRLPGGSTFAQELCQMFYYSPKGLFHALVWDRKNVEKFWLKLRLRLPPNRGNWKCTRNDDREEFESEVTVTVLEDDGPPRPSSHATINSNPTRLNAANSMSGRRNSEVAGVNARAGTFHNLV